MKSKGELMLNTVDLKRFLIVDCDGEHILRAPSFLALIKFIIKSDVDDAKITRIEEIKEKI